MRTEGAARAEAACRGRTQGRARVLLEVGEGPDGWGQSGGEGGREMGWTGPLGLERERRSGWLGWATRWKKKKKKGCWVGPCGRKGREGEKKKERVGRLGRGKKKKKEKEKEMGRAKREREGEKEMHLNTFKF
jgi:hypothetical protein